MSDAPITPKYQQKAPLIMARIMEDFPFFTDEDAAAPVGNFGQETGGFMLREEQNKPDKDSRGYGWAQWTGMDPGERRRLFEDWCKSHGFKDVVDNPLGCPEERYDEACYGYFLHEVTYTWEKRVFEGPGATIEGVFYKPVPECKTLEEKTTSFMRLYERPGTPHEDRRHEMAREALRLYRGGKPGETRMPTIVISSGHGLYVRGASGILDEVDEARRVVDRLAEELRKRGATIFTFHDDVSTTQNENLKRIVDFHNGKERDLDVSVHFNAYEQVSKPMGCEVLYYSQGALAAEISAAIAAVGFIDRGAKKRTDLYFLNNTEEPAVLLEICFVDSEADAGIYNARFSDICDNITDLIGEEPDDETDTDEETDPEVARVDIEVGGDVIVMVNGERVN